MVWLRSRINIWRECRATRDSMQPSWCPLLLQGVDRWDAIDTVGVLWCGVQLGGSPIGGRQLWHVLLEHVPLLHVKLCALCCDVWFHGLFHCDTCLSMCWWNKHQRDVYCYDVNWSCMYCLDVSVICSLANILWHLMLLVTPVTFCVISLVLL